MALLSRQVEDNYGHFLHEVIAGFHQLKLINLTPDFYILPLNTPFQKQMYDLLGIPLKNIIPSSPNTLIQVRQLIIPTLMADYEFVEYRKHSHTCTFAQPLFSYFMYDYLLPQTSQKKKYF